MKKLLLCVIAVITIGAIIGCQTPPQQIAETNRYEAPSFSLEYPKDWIVTEQTLEEGFLTRLQPYKDSTTSIVVELGFNLYPSVYSEYWEVRDTSVDGLPAKEYSCIYQGPVITKVTEITFSAEEITYWLSYTANYPDQYDEYYDCFRLMVDTFRVEET